MRVFETRFEAEDFLSYHNINYSEYSTILERKDRKFIVFEKGDIIIFENVYYIYLGYVPDPNQLPKNINSFYKDGPFIKRRFYPKCTKLDVYRFYNKMQEEHKQEILESMKKLDKSVLQVINGNGKYIDKEIIKKRRENDIRTQGIRMLGGQCCKCGSKYQLSFVHRDPKDKISSVSKMIKENRSKDVILNEMLKCDLYCESCRQEFFRNLQRKQYQSGAREKYKK